MDKTIAAELLIVKSGTDYIRFTESGYETCPMNKGSVFSLSAGNEVKEKCTRLLPEHSAFQIMKLTIFEEPFTLP